MYELISLAASLAVLHCPFSLCLCRTFMRVQANAAAGNHGGGEQMAGFGFSTSEKQFEIIGGRVGGRLWDSQTLQSQTPGASGTRN